MNYIFLGQPGVGKGTYASRVIEKLGILQISTGDLLRGAVKQGTETGIKAREYMDSGELVPDDIVITLLKERISQDDCGQGFILDGFPRTIKQAEALDDQGIKIDAVINLIAPKEIIIQRLSGRRVCRKCGAIFHLKNIPPKVNGICDRCRGELYQRDDDKPAAISERLDVYVRKTAPLIDYYKEKGILRKIDARGEDIPQIVGNIIEAMQT